MSNDAPSELSALIEGAVLHLDDEDNASQDPPTGWWAISLLRQRADQDTLNASIALCRSSDPTRRRVGAAILGQLGHDRPGFQPKFVEERFEALHGLLISEMDSRADTEVLEDLCVALGHLGDVRAIETMASLRTHPVSGVRYGVVHGLSGYENDLAIRSLIELSTDTDDAVRDWATFSLAQLVKSDTPAIREALRARLNDANPDVLNEAISGLAMRKDPEVIAVLIRELNRQAALPLFEAAVEIADAALCEALVASEQRGLVWDSEGQAINLEADWNDAMKACGCLQQP
jgi:HEAT repeat protein